jgi:site-specific DNA recombinase
MMLNILITFAQYEREVITERVRDKMAATRKKGKFVGGSVPMGYNVVDKKLVINQREAEVIRKIFSRYVEIQSPKLIAMELNEQGIKTKQGKQWSTPHVGRILNNHTYIGEIKYKDVICAGEQDAIITRELWERVKEIQRTIDPQADHSRRQETIAPLKNILRCGHCDGAMKPTYSSKGTRRYYYYLCSKDSKRATSECPVKQIPAGDIEELVRKQIQKMLSDISLVIHFAERSGMSPLEVVECFREEFWNEITPGEYNRLLILLVEKAVVWEDKLEVVLKTCGIKSLLEEFKNE